jgi:hypothetical protein
MLKALVSRFSFSIAHRIVRTCGIRRWTFSLERRIIEECFLNLNPGLFLKTVLM